MLLLVQNAKIAPLAWESVVPAFADQTSSMSSKTVCAFIANCILIIDIY